MSKLKSELWKSLSEKEKEKYEQMAKEKMKLNPVVNDKPEKKKVKHHIICLADKELRKSISEKIKTTDMKEVNKEMVKKWKSLSDKDKKKYVDLAEMEKNKMSEETEVVKEQNEVVKEETEVVKEKPKKEDCC